jgi:hypothetical protein
MLPLSNFLPTDPTLFHDCRLSLVVLYPELSPVSLPNSKTPLLGWAPCITAKVLNQVYPTAFQQGLVSDFLLIASWPPSLNWTLVWYCLLLVNPAILAPARLNKQSPKTLDFKKVSSLRLSEHFCKQKGTCWFTKAIPRSYMVECTLLPHP